MPGQSITAPMPPLRLLLVLLLGAWPLMDATAAPGNQVLLAPRPYAQVLSAAITGLSGIVKAPGRDNTYWVVNGSGDTARIFAITAEGKSILPTYSRFTSYGDEPEKGKQQWQGFPVLAASNVDWQDIAADNNYLYLADTGNQDNTRRDLGIYLISKIDPTASTRSAVIQYLPVVYADQHGFPPSDLYYDSHSLFVDNGTPYLITRHRQSAGNNFVAGATLYRLDSRHTDKSNVLTPVDSNALLLAAAGAGLSPDGRMLAVIAQDALWLFARPAKGDHWLSAAARRYPIDRSVLQSPTALTWMDQGTLLLANRQRELYKVVIAELPAPTPP